MEMAFAWIGKLAEWIGAFAPRWVILDTTEAAVKYVRGRPKFCASGRIHWFWPAATKMEKYPIARQTDRLETQTMESTDGKTFIVSGLITYRIDSLMDLLPTTHSPMTTVIDTAMAAIHDICCDFSWEELQSEQRKGTLKTKLRNEAQKQLKDYGVTVVKLQLNTLARARVLKISQSTSSEEN